MTARSALRVLREEGLIYTVPGRGSYVADAIGPEGERIEPKRVESPRTASKTETAPASAEAAGTLAEALLEIREQLRTLNAEVQNLKQEVAELKSR